MATSTGRSARSGPVGGAGRAVLRAAGCIAACLAVATGAAGERVEAGDRPIDTFLVLDNSGSMRAHDPGRATDALVVRFAEAMPEGGRLGVVLFDETARVVQPLTADVGAGSARRWADVVARIDYRGQRTNGPAGVERALYALEHDGRPGSRKAIVLVTDGVVDTGDPARDAEKTRWLKEELVVAARRAGVRIFGVAFTEAADVELIQALALGTGGDYWRVERPEQIGGLVTRVGEILRSPPARGAHAATEGAPAAGPARVAPGRAGGEPAMPPVSAAASDRTQGLVLLAIGLVVAAGVLLLPVVDRLRRRPRLPASAFVDPFRRDLPAGLALPALPRAGRPPVVKLVDPAGATGPPGSILLLEKPTSRIGRDPSSEVAIPDDTVSSFHATIDYRDGYFYLEDQRSTNGTALNGEALEAHRPVRLKSGDSIRVASWELRFLVPDHEPRGRTAVLAGTALPAGDDAGASPGSGGRENASPERLVAAFDRCLSAHLARVEGLGEAHRRFVDRAFPLEIRALLVRRSQDLLERCEAEGQAQQGDWARAAIHYTLCVVPDAPAGARAWFVERFGGYAKFLVGLLDARTGGSRGDEAICVVTYGTRPEPWVGLTVVPARDDAEAIELMSLELLSPDERREASDLDLVDVGRDLPRA